MVPEYGFAPGELQRGVHKLDEEASFFDAQVFIIRNPSNEANLQNLATIKTNFFPVRPP